MLNLDGYLDFKLTKEVSNYIQIRVRHDVNIKDIEAVALYEQNYLDNPIIKKLCEEVQGEELFEPLVSYMPQDIVSKFQGTGLVPVMNKPMAREILCVYHPDIEWQKPELTGYNLIECKPTTASYYFKVYQDMFGNHPYLFPIAAKDLFDAIVEEAVKLGTSDITIASTEKKCVIYYNIRKKKVYSKRLLSADYMTNIIDYVFREGTTFEYSSNIPQDTACDLTSEYRGRVSCTKKYKGYMITIRVLPKKAFDDTFDSLNISKKSQDFLINEFMNVEPGLHIICGATMSGKNTTILACLKRIAQKDYIKIVSVERPVEQELFGVEQISCETDQEYESVCAALIRMNPDLVYITEINDKCAESVMKIANTGKCVIATIHANGVRFILDRLEDVTNQDCDKLLVNIHSVVYQTLERDETTDTIKPKLRFLRFDDSVKSRLFDKTRGEKYNILAELEDGD